MKKSPGFFLITLGCPKNLVDSNNLIKKMLGGQFIYSDKPGNSDFVLVNTCGFIRDAKKESIDEILRLANTKTTGQKLIVYGCLAKRYKDELCREIPEIDALFGVGEEDRIVKYCKSVKGQKYDGAKAQKITKTRETKNFRTSELLNYSTSHAYLKIAEGCDKKCTYCVIPSIRGGYKSAGPDLILREAEGFVRSGIKELILIAQDTASYGMDLKGYDLKSLLNDIASIEGDFWIRLLYMYPSSITGPLLEMIAGEDKICKYIDMPLQHSEDRILRLMKRSGTRKSYLNLINKTRNIIPDITLRTTFIVGFPGETEDDFKGLRDFIEEVEFDRLGIFKYSKEEGTPAYKMKGNISEKIKKRRFDELMRIQSKISLRKNEKLAGKTLPALIDEIDGKLAFARLASQAPEIDGEVFIRQPGISSQESGIKSHLKIGDFVDVKIIRVFDYDLEGIFVI